MKSILILSQTTKLSMKEIFLPLRTNSFEKPQIKKVKFNTESYINIKKITIVLI
jgi:hypothetical protein